MIIQCPRCGKETGTEANRHRPFCSEHCKLLDLGKWLEGSYRIPTNTAEEDEDGEGSLDIAEKE